ncbi:hypothetical protein CDD80_2176 [Ophiocordyceps camponoti-rufipedis]|uniref:Endonuclease III homolog n=1 Tax=Ophiocordyceps camponoti-rufipedis TaxID=2004952 RepID=A0A2C5Z3U1_9HYPO|nr:hypothetical protein CDD80_2176 [Ophiocordyceps camponoti-rufipedis]
MNLLSLTTLVVGASLLVAVVYKTWYALCGPMARLPGPWHSKWTDAVMTSHWLRGSLCQYVHSLHERYGPTVRVGPNQVSIADLASVKSIYSTRETFIKADWYKNFMLDDQQNVFTAVGSDAHRRRRKLLAGPISDSSLRVHHDRVGKRVRLAVDGMRDEMASRGATDVLRWFTCLAADVVAELTFGLPLGMLERGQQHDECSRHLESAVQLGAWRTAFPRLVNLAWMLPFSIFRVAYESAREQTRIATNCLTQYKKLVDSGSKPETLFRNLYKAAEANEMTAKDICSEAELYFLAGSDTTANTLSYLVWAVSGHPKIQETLVSELRTLPAEGWDEARLRQLPYLDHVIQEALRLYGAAPAPLPRVVPAGGAEVGGYWLAEGTWVGTQAYTMHRDPTIFPDPRKFDPDRWEQPTKDMRDAFMPFGRGPRICLGQHLAAAELRLMTASFFLAFPDARMSSLEGMSDEDMGERNFFVMAPRGRRCLMEAASGLSEPPTTSEAAFVRTGVAGHGAWTHYSIGLAGRDGDGCGEGATVVDMEDAVGPPAKRRKRQPTTTKTTKTTATAPAGWHETYEAVRRMRSPGGLAHGAPVDTMGCERLADRQASAKDQRFQTLVALMLSSQTKDTVNAAAMHRLKTELPPFRPGATAGLTVDNVLAADPAVLNDLIYAVGFHNNKTKYLQQTAAVLRDNWDGDIPDTIAGLTALPGVGPKMAYLCLSAAWGRTEGIGVDVHVHRITNLWGWQQTRSPEETRRALEAWLPRDRWHEINSLLVGLGQVVCRPVGRRCGECELGQRGLCRAAKRS